MIKKPYCSGWCNFIVACCILLVLYLIQYVYPNKKPKLEKSFDEVVTQSNELKYTYEAERIKEKMKLLHSKVKEAEVDYEKNVAAIHRYDLALLVTQRVLSYLNEGKCKDQYPMIIHVHDSEQRKYTNKYECILFLKPPSAEKNTTVRFSKDEVTIFIDDFEKDESFINLTDGLKDEFLKWERHCNIDLIDRALRIEYRRKECLKNSSIFGSMKQIEKRLDESYAIAQKVKSMGLDINVSSYMIVIDAANNRVKVKPEYLKI